MPTFRINYSQVISQANQINHYAGDLKTQINSLEAMAQETRSNWQGQAADAFLKQVSELMTDMNSTSRRMTKLAATIKEVAYRIQREDEEAAARATSLHK